MMHTKKIVMVPHDVTQNRIPVDNIIDKLEYDLQNMMNDKNHAIDVKLVKYNQILQRYNTMTRKKKAPYAIEFQEEIPSLFTDEQILEGIPEKQLKHAKLLLENVKNSPHINSTPSGEIILDGNIIHGSNIVDLIHDFSRESKSRSPALGSEKFAKVLDRSNIPLECIGNKQRLKLFRPVHNWAERVYK
jgi:hypothetical protein